MTGVRPKSITIELVILFVAVLGIAELLSLSYRYIDRSEALSALESIRIADRVAGVVSLVEKTPPGDRQKLLETFRGSELPAVWTTERWPINDKEPNKEARLLRDLLLRVLPRSDDTDVVVSYLPSAASLPPQGKGELAMVWRKAGPFPEPIPQIVDELTAEPTFLVTIRLGDGTWLNLLAAYVENIDFWPFRSMFDSRHDDFLDRRAVNLGYCSFDLSVSSLRHRGDAPRNGRECRAHPGARAGGCPRSNTRLQ